MTGSGASSTEPQTAGEPVGTAPVRLFRDAAVSQRIGEIGLPLGVSSRWMHVYVGVVLVTMAVFAGVVAFGTYTRKAHVSGYLVPVTGLLKVYPSRAGFVTKRFVSENQHVDKDAPLFELDVSATTDAGRSGEVLIAKLTHRKKLLGEERRRLEKVDEIERARSDEAVRSLRAQREAIDQQIGSQARLVALLAREVDRKVGLQAKGWVSWSDREQTERDHAAQVATLSGLERARVTTSGDLQRAELDRAALDDRQANDLSAIDRSIAEIDQQLVDAGERNTLLVQSPMAGTVTRIVPDPGQAVQSTANLVTIIPAGAHLQAYVYVPSKAIGFVKPGSRVLLRYEAYPFQKFGIQEGMVSQVTHTAVPVPELPFAVQDNSQPFYLVVVNLAKQTIRAYGQEEGLKAGQRFDADLMLDNRAIWEWILDPLYAIEAALRT
jgi:membrane fusion protein